MVEFFNSVSSFLHQLYVDADTMANVIEWSKNLPNLFGDIHPVLRLGFVLFSVFLTLKILIHLL